MAVRFHWIIENKLAGMERPGYHDPLLDDLLFLMKKNIDVIVTLTEEPLDSRSHLARKFKWIHFPIDDFMAPDPARAYDLIREVNRLIEQENKRVLFHCLAGIGRTGTMLAAYLIYTRNISALDAISFVRSINRAYIQSAVQEEFLDEFEVYANAMKSAKNQEV